VLGVALLAAAVATELRKPAAERTWHGAIARKIPYDLRAPTFSRVKRSVWAPDDDRVFTPQPFGVGWTVNVGRIARLARRR
jgi:Family of unknown function (DUF5808)